MTSTRRRRTQLWLVASSVFLSGAIAIVTDRALAQNVTLDGTLGPARLLTGPQYNILQSDGQTVSSNLFHSFEKLNLSLGERITFYSDPQVRNILARVTGGQSLINGFIQTYSGNVNLFLLNPNGISFGPHASLDVGNATRGSFVATTVDALVWPNGRQFSATNPGGPNSLLTLVGDPGGFLSSLRPPQPIDIVGSNLSNPASNPYNGQSLLLLGGDVRINGGNLQAPGGRVELAGVAGVGTVGLNVNGNNLSLSFPDSLARADVSLTNGATVNVRSGGGGSIAVNAQNFNMAGGSSLRAGIALNKGAVGSQAGDVDIKAISTVNLTGGSFIENLVGTGAAGKGGNINVQADSVSFADGSNLIAATFGQADAGSVNITARDRVAFDGEDQSSLYPSSGVYDRVEAGAVGHGGNINIATGSLSITHGAVVSTSIDGTGDAGNVNINARDTISFAGEGSLDDQLSSGVYSAVKENGRGDGGSINITTGSLSVAEGAVLNASSLGHGNAGNISIDARDWVAFAGEGTDLSSSGAYSGVGTTGVGHGGNIKVTTGSLSLTNGALLQVSTESRQGGDAGNVIVNAHDQVSFDGEGSFNPALGFRQSSGAYSRVQAGAMGNGGSVNITTGSLSVTNGAALQANTAGRGNAGSVNIDAHNLVFLDGQGHDSFSSGLYSQVEFGAVGKGGSVNVTTGSLSVTNGGLLTTSTNGQGRAGDVTINARDTVSFAGEGRLDQTPSGAFSSVRQNGVGQGGSVNVTTRSLSVTDGAKLIVSTLGHGDAGSVNINASDQVVFDGRSSNSYLGLYSSAAVSRVEAGAAGKGGRIAIATGSLFVTNGAGLTTSTLGPGKAGDIQVTADAVEVIGTGSSLSVNSVGQGSGPAGDLRLTARSVYLDNQGQLAAETDSSQGGNITLHNLDLLLMRHGSEISTTAGKQDAGGDGGNIDIRSTLIVAIPQEDSDIRANAYTGKGGRVDITTQGMFGLQFRPKDTPLSDITASSQFGLQGNVNVNTPGIAPSRGLGNLPTTPVDVSRQIAQGCPAGVGSRASKFVVTGRGGLPPTPQEATRSESPLADLGTPVPVQAHRASTDALTNPTSSEPTPLVEAQGWIINAKGEVMLTAQAPNGTPHSPWLKPVGCHTVKTLS